MTLRLEFDATLRAKSEMGAFPADTVSMMYITNRDDCSWAEVPVGKDGGVKVRYDMKSERSDVKLTSRVKLFFFFEDVHHTPTIICAGHLPIGDLIERVRDGGRPFECCSNFTTNQVTMEFTANPHSTMHLDHQRLLNAGLIEPSALDRSAEYVDHFKKLDDSVKSGLERNLQITNENGASMFLSMMTGHVMEGEATLYNLYHEDFDGRDRVPLWLTTYLLAETMHQTALTCEAVKKLPHDKLTRFVAAFAQAPMRSATATPYTSDYTMNPDPKKYRTTLNTKLSEVFKRPFCHPYQCDANQLRGGLMYDDCEGLAAFIRDLTNSLASQHVRFGAMWARVQQPSERVKCMDCANILRTCCPQELFGPMEIGHRMQLMDLVMYIGQKIHAKVIEPKITLVTANAASMSGPPGTKEIQAHACASLVCNDPACRLAIMLEGTACMVDEVRTKKIQVGSEYMPLTDVANSVSADTHFNTFAQETKVKVAMHVQHTKGSFYRTAFCQNNTLLGSQIGKAPLSFGVDMEFLDDPSVLVHMPVQGKVLERDRFEELRRYVQARACEIHPPFLSHEMLLKRLQWAPIALFRGCSGFDPERPFINCMLHITAHRPEDVGSILARCQKEADAFNTDPKHAGIGLTRAFPSMDGVCKVMSLYTDDTRVLEKCLKSA